MSLSKLSKLTDKSFTGDSEIEPEMALYVPSSGQIGRFKILPDNISDNRGVNFASKAVVGGSHPIYQWVTSGERTVSFKILLSHENKIIFARSKLERAGNALKNPLFAALSQLNKGQYENDQGIMESLEWLRALTYPVKKPKGLIGGPPVLKLYLMTKAPTQTTVGVTGSPPMSAKFVMNLSVILNSVNVNFEALFADGTPRLATVDLQFSEVVQSTNNWVVTADQTQRLFGRGEDKALERRVAGAVDNPVSVPEIKKPSKGGI